MTEDEIERRVSKMIVINPYLALAEELKAISEKCDDFIVVHGFTVQCSEAQVKEMQQRSRRFFDHLIACVNNHTKVLQGIALKQSLEN